MYLVKSFTNLKEYLHSCTNHSGSSSTWIYCFYAHNPTLCKVITSSDLPIGSYQDLKIRPSIPFLVPWTCYPQPNTSLAICLVVCLRPSMFLQGFPRGRSLIPTKITSSPLISCHAYHQGFWRVWSWGSRPREELRGRLFLFMFLFRDTFKQRHAGTRQTSGMERKWPNDRIWRYCVLWSGVHVV